MVLVRVCLTPTARRFKHRPRTGGWLPLCEAWGAVGRPFQMESGLAPPTNWELIVRETDMLSAGVLFNRAAGGLLARRGARSTF